MLLRSALRRRCRPLRWAWCTDLGVLALCESLCDAQLHDIFAASSRVRSQQWSKSLYFAPPAIISLLTR